MIRKFKVAAAPHMRRNSTTKLVMVDVLISLSPVIVVAVKYFGIIALKMIIFSIFMAGLAEYLVGKVLNKKTELHDMSFAVTGALLALILPHTTPFWVIAIGDIFAISIGKVIFGGLGKNIFNPVLLGRVFLMISFPQYLLNFKGYDGSGGATLLPLQKYTPILSVYRIFGNKEEFFKALFTGHGIYGSMGEISIIAVLVGMVYLKVKGHIRLKMPIIFILTVFLGSIFVTQYPLIYVMSGGLFFAAVFIITDPATSPYTKAGEAVYSMLAGIFILLIRVYTSYPEGIAFGILIANLFVPFINKHTQPRVFGKGYNMKDIKIAVISLILTLLGLWVIFKVDEKLKVNKRAAEEKQKRIMMMEMVPLAKRIGEDKETVIYGGYLFRPLFDKNNSKIAYVIEDSAKGYSKKYVDYILAIDLEGETIGYKVVKEEETKGLGNKITEEKWQKSFVGLTMNSEFNKEEDAYSGATYTFLNMYKSIMDILNAYENEKDTGIQKVDNEEDDILDGEGGSTQGEWEEADEEIENLDQKDFEEGTENIKNEETSFSGREGYLWG